MKAIAAAALALALAAPAAGRGFPVGLDIATGRVNGQVVLGKPIAEVVRRFGRPDGYLRTSNVTYVRYGSALTFSLLVLFRRQGDSLVASGVVFQNPSLVEVRLGRVLALSPKGIQRAVRRAYGALFRLVQPYHCTGGQECSGVFDAVSGGRHITFGLAAGHAFLNLWRG